MIKRLVSLANRLDAKGLHKEADQLDALIALAAVPFRIIVAPLKDVWDPLGGFEIKAHTLERAKAIFHQVVREPKYTQELRDAPGVRGFRVSLYKPAESGRPELEDQRELIRGEDY